MVHMCPFTLASTRCQGGTFSNTNCFPFTQICFIYGNHAKVSMKSPRSLVKAGVSLVFLNPCVSQVVLVIDAWQRPRAGGCRLAWQAVCCGALETSAPWPHPINTVLQKLLTLYTCIHVVHCSSGCRVIQPSSTVIATLDQMAPWRKVL